MCDSQSLTSADGSLMCCTGQSDLQKENKKVIQLYFKSKIYEFIYPNEVICHNRLCTKTLNAFLIRGNTNVIDGRRHIHMYLYLLNNIKLNKDWIPWIGKRSKTPTSFEYLIKADGKCPIVS